MITHPRRWLPPAWIDVWDHARFELESTLGRLRQKRLYRFPEHTRLNLGCGPGDDARLPGFLNVDFFRWRRSVDLALDLRYPLPLESGAWKAIYCHHTLEHISYPAAGRLLAECHRLLAPGGILRLVVPDAGKYLRLYAAGDEASRAEVRRLYENHPPFATPMEAINHLFRDTKFNEHLFAYDYETLASLLHGAGFPDAWPSQVNQSVLPELNHDRAHWAKFSLYAEARRAAI
jgi:predicted SAM-dependent methyltransferase